MKKIKEESKEKNKERYDSEKLERKDKECQRETNNEPCTSEIRDKRKKRKKDQIGKPVDACNLSCQSSITGGR